MRKFLTILVLALATNVVFGQDVQSVLNRYYTATGTDNIEAELKGQSWKMDVLFDMVFVKMGIKFNVKSEDVYRVEMSVGNENMGTIIVADGVAWVVSPTKPLKKITNKKEIEKANMMGEMFKMVTLAADKYDIKYVGTKGSGDSLVEVLELNPKSLAGKEQPTTYYFDANTGLISYCDSAMDGQTTSTRVFYKGYKKFGKYTLPTSVGAQDTGMTIGIIINDLEIGCEVDDKLFEKPKK